MQIHIFIFSISKILQVNSNLLLQLRKMDGTLGHKRFADRIAAGFGSTLFSSLAFLLTYFT